MRPLLSILLLIAALHASPPSATAQIAAAPDSARVRVFRPVVVTATRLGGADATGPAPEERFSAADIAAAPARSLADMLGEAAGMGLKLYGADGGLGTASLRGLGPEYTVVTLNGVKLNDAQNGLVNTASLRLAGIDGVTVARGGFSSLYGSDAAGGIIAVTTGTTGAPLELGAGLGSYGRRTLEGAASASIAGAALRLTAYYEAAANDFPARMPAAQPAIESVRSDADFIATGARCEITAPAGASVVTGFVQASRLDAGTPGAWLQAAQGRARQDDREVIAGAAWRVPLRRDATLTFTPSFHWTDSHYNDPDIVIDGQPLASRHQNTSAGLSAVAEAALSPALRGAAGVEASFARLRSADVDGDPRRALLAAFVTAELRPPGVDVLRVFPSLRWDLIADEPGARRASRVSPSLGATVDLVPRTLVLRAHAALGFRLPTFNQLYWNPGGNTALKPEHAASVDAGVILTPAGGDDARFELTGFLHDITDKIVWAPGQGRIWRPTNIQHVVSGGLETTADLSLCSGAVRMRLNGQWMRAIKKNSSFTGDNTAGRSLVYVPELSGSFSILLRAAPWLTLSAVERAVGEQYTTETNDAALPAYAVTDIAISSFLEFSGVRLRVKFELLNAFDAAYQAVAWFPMPPRNYRISFTTTIE